MIFSSDLHRKSIVEDPVCDLCQEGDKIADHLIFGCRFTQAFWAAVGRTSPLTPVSLRLVGSSVSTGRPHNAL
jgi:hypothetical protein